MPGQALSFFFSFLRFPRPRGALDLAGYLRMSLIEWLSFSSSSVFFFPTPSLLPPQLVQSGLVLHGHPLFGYATFPRRITSR